MAGIEGDGDFAVFFDPDGFGSLGSYVLAAGGEPVEVGGIFSAANSITAQLGDWPGVSTSAPLFTCRASALPAGAGDGDTSPSARRPGPSAAFNRTGRASPA